jgi:hypothetical protein
MKHISTLYMARGDHKIRRCKIMNRKGIAASIIILAAALTAFGLYRKHIK